MPGTKYNFVMLFKFILEFLIMLALGAIVYLMARALPRVSDTDTSAPEGPVVPHWFMAYVERFDEWLLLTFEKMLRKFRLLILKVDNVVTKKLNRFKKGTPKETPLGNGEKGEENTPLV